MTREVAFLDGSAHQRFRLEYGVHLGSAQHPFLVVDSCYRGEQTSHLTQIGTREINLSNWLLRFVENQGSGAQVQISALVNGEVQRSSWSLVMAPNAKNGLLLLLRDRISGAPLIEWCSETDLEEFMVRNNVWELRIGDPNQLYRVDWQLDTAKQRYDQTETVFSDGKVTCLRSAWTLSGYNGPLEFDVTGARWVVQQTTSYSAMRGENIVMRRLITNVHPSDIQSDLLRLQVWQQAHPSPTAFGTVR